MYYGNFFRFFEMAEEELFLSLGRDRGEVYQELQVGFPRVEVWCRYRKPARLGDLLDVTLWIEKRTRSSLVIRLEMRRAGETDLVCQATSRLVCVNRQFHPTHIPDELTALLRDYLPPITTHTHEETGHVPAGSKHPSAE